MAHVKVKELVAAAHAAAPELPPAAAQLMQDIASRLDVTFVALTEAMDQNTALSAMLGAAQKQEKN
ncbi:MULTISPECIES: hypothetical protein [Klebsiella/Raoultella group]|jgi:hypothetical protein|uniref:Uncharacterized protein n=1 Tax=Raoultella planticola TaxID=575 RepID=A0ABU5M9I7_RAOPL|nr:MULTISPECIES: hypothetical protein [Klebsiella/Raoultella group]KAB8158736.1 hypothetical protein FNV36_11475 [Raoultella ornithinolytica]KAB8168390.1 hypothetical protein FNV35_13325 [Raoultella ornithinolytica]MCI7917741.1 hypothetical protein [Klebsiella pneumoniae]MCI7922873.1 hypothetical protein [Klebsiella pneumoniae]MDI0348276.1 hypothetical protein [Raoultella ornithinolytica]